MCIRVCACVCVIHAKRKSERRRVVIYFFFSLFFSVFVPVKLGEFNNITQHMYLRTTSVTVHTI